MKLELIYEFPLRGRRSRAVNNHGFCLMDTSDGTGLWTAEGQQLWHRKMDWPFTCALSNDNLAYVGNRTYSSGPSSLFCMKEQGTLKQRLKLPFGELVNIALSPCEESLIAISNGDDTRPRLYSTTDFATKPAELKKGNRAGYMKRVLWSPNGEYLLTLADKSHKTPSLSVAVRDLRIKKGLLWYGFADCAIFTPQNRLITWAYGTSDTIKLWELDLETNPEPIAIQHIPHLPLYPIRKMALVHGGRLALSMNGRIILLDSETLEIVGEFSLEAYFEVEPDLTTSADGRFILCNSGSGSALFILA